jgi:hypothetical protein
MEFAKMTPTCPEKPFKLAAEVLNAAVDMTERLATSETLSGTPTVTEATSALTLSNKVVNSAATIINGTTVAASNAITFVVAGGVAGTAYEILASCVTSTSQTVSELLSLRVV